MERAAVTRTRSQNRWRERDTTTENLYAGAAALFFEETREGRVFRLFFFFFHPSRTHMGCSRARGQNRTAAVRAINAAGGVESGG